MKDETKNQVIDDTKDTVHTFLDKIAVAKMNGDEWIETTPEIIMHYNRHGLNGAKYFIYDGIKVAVTGTVEDIVKEEDTPVNMRVFGKDEPKSVIG